MKKLLLVANVSKEHIRKFHIPFILKMKAEGWNVDVACRLDEPIQEADKTYDLPCDRNPLKGNIVKSIIMLRNIIEENKYNVIHCNTITGSIVGRIAAIPYRKKGVKIIYTNHGLHFFKSASPIRWICGYPMEKLLSYVTDVLITVNSADYQMAKKCLNTVGVIEQIHGIGVNLDRFRKLPVGYDSLEYREKIGLYKDDYVLTYVAELIPNKNQEALLNVLVLVLQKIPSAKLLLVGPDHEDGLLQRIAVEKGISKSVFFLGWRDDIPEILSLSDVYVASSKSEGLGLNLIEAMACNVPVVAFENRGHSEIINHGKNGFLVKQNDFEKMAKYILLIHDNKKVKEDITLKAQNDINKYEIGNVLKELYEIYEKHVVNI